MARIATEFLGGLQLAVDRKLLQKPSVVSGRNFVVEVEGPKTAFAFEQIQNSFWHQSYIQSFRCADQLIYFGRDVIANHIGCYFLNWPKKQVELLFDIYNTDPYTDFPVSFAQVGGKWYFAHRGFGIVEYDKSLQKFTVVTPNFPSNTFYIAESGGRCIAVSPGFVSWSAIDDANDFTSSTITGAGAQSLAITGTPTKDSGYLGLQSTATGFLVFLSTGTLRGTLIDSSLVFRFSNIDDAKIPFTPNCIAKISTSQIIVLAKQGLFATNGQNFEPWQPLMGEYLKKQVLPKLQEETIGQINLQYAKPREWFFVSYTLSANYGLYDHAFVSYLPREEWGSFDFLHKGFIEIDELNNGSSFAAGFVNESGRPAKFEISTSNTLLEAQPDSSPSDLQNAVFYSDELYDAPYLQFDSINFVSTNSRASGLNFIHETLANQQIAIPQIPGWYEINGLVQTESEDDAIDPIDETSDGTFVASNSTNKRIEFQVFGFIKQDVYQTTLDAEFEIGPFRFTDNQAHDQMSLVSDCSISMTETSEDATVNDWLVSPNPDVTNDWMANPNGPDSVSDWGYGIADGSNYLASFVATNDGYKEIDSQTIETYDQESRTRFYTPDIVGLYCFVKLEAKQVNEYMHLKHIEINGNLAGRL